MNTKKDLIEQTGLAFDLIQKLYLESSYLIKEIEGILGEEEEKFIIGKPSGYGVTSRSSSGLESHLVNFWLLKKFAVFFVPETKTKTIGGQTITELEPDLKVIYLRCLLRDKDLEEPTLISGVLSHIHKKDNIKWKKFENVMSRIEYNDRKIFSRIEKLVYEDNYFSVAGKLFRNSLFDIADSEAILDRIIKPCLKLYRSQ